MLEGTTKIAIGVKNDLLALDLILGRAGHIEIDLLDSVEAIRNIAPRHLHPDIVDALEEIDLLVVQLVDHLLRIVTDGVERFGDLAVALADLHGLGLLAHHLVEHAGLAQGAGDDHDAVLIQIRDLFQKSVDRRVHGLGRDDPELAQGGCRLVEILQGRFNDDVGHEVSSEPERGLSAAPKIVSAAHDRTASISTAV